jgi:SNF2 family DNA or RNA helicase
LATCVLHANWTAGALHLWAEATPDQGGEPAPAGAPAGGSTEGVAHPFAADHGLLARALERALGAGVRGAEGSCQLRLPVHTLASGRIVPLASPRAAHMAGHLDHEETGADTDARVVMLDVVRVPTMVLAGMDAVRALEALDGWLAEQHALPAPAGHAEAELEVLASPSVEFFVSAARLVDWLLVQQRFVPALVQEPGGGVRGLWQPWLADEGASQRAMALLAGMPPIARATVDGAGHDGWAVIEDFLVRVGDARCRRVLVREQMSETIESRRARPGTGVGAGAAGAAAGEGEDPHVTWLAGLLGEADGVQAIGARRTDMLKRVRGWIGGLDQRSSDAGWRLCLKVSEPAQLPELAGIVDPGDKARWTLQFSLQSIEHPGTTISAQDIWVLPTDGAMVAGRRLDQPQELLLAELGRAARVYRPLELALSSSEPVDMGMSTQQAYDFLREHRQLLLEQGFGVLAPAWWDSPSARLGVRLRIDSPDDLDASLAASAAAAASTGSRLGLQALVNYKWQISLGQTALSLDEFQKLADIKSPLVYVGGKWVEVRPEDIKAAVAFIRENPGGEIEIGKALRMAFAADAKTTGVPVVGLEATGWASAIFGGTGTSEQQKNFSMPMLGPPPGFVGSLRPYQVKGLSWLAFLDKLGLGSCLADDMGLGKTIQLLAMLLHERVPAEQEGQRVLPPPNGPTLLIVPMSVVGNWVRETRRFAPSLKVLVHHGAERALGEDFCEQALSHDLVITTYALSHRDREDLAKIAWHRVALDEAQNIKNPVAKQTLAVRGVEAPRRIALTGTPVENRLTELWSIMDFLNPGLLGGVQEFRTRFALPIEKYSDAARGRQLRSLVQPFVLRRLKTDPQVIADLPEKVETKEFCYLTPEQAALYEQVVKGMLQQAEEAQGIQRRGVILAGLTKLKQVCNHPLQYLRHDLDEDGAPVTPVGPSPSVRSGKATRLVQMLDEVVASGGQALVFTQFRAMGEMLAAMLRHELDREVLLLHGGTSAKDRDALVQRFQKGDGGAPIFVLSLKAGGIGLNLTAANHVFHYDRWWNPAVENQATDRAFRIGQTRTVQVHKFVVAGTLEEKIDQMIEAKAGLADNVIGSGESWLTELSLNQLREVLMLRDDAVTAEEVDA